jgi:hypothetical protein
MSNGRERESKPDGKTVLETRDAVRKLAGLPEAVRQLQDDQIVMIRILQAPEAELDLMRSLEQQYAGLRARMVEFERRLAKLEAGQ